MVRPSGQFTPRVGSRTNPTTVDRSANPENAVSRSVNESRLLMIDLANLPHEPIMLLIGPSDGFGIETGTITLLKHSGIRSRLS